MRIADAPSIYSARLRLGTAKAAEPPADVAGGFAEIIAKDFTTISAAAHPAFALQQLVLLQGDFDPKPLYVIDEKGGLAGRFSAASIADRDELHRPIEMSTASDLAEPVNPLTSSLSKAEALAQLAESSQSELPVVSAEGGGFVGVLRKAQLRGLGKDPLIPR